MRTMKLTSSVTLVALCMLSFAVPVTAQFEKDKAAIQAVIDGAWAALSAQDLEKFNTFCAPEWQLYANNGNKLDADRLFTVHKTNVKNFKLEQSNVKIVVNGRMAYATYDATMSGLMKEKPFGGNFIMTDIFEKKNGKWMCIHMHESKKAEPQP